MSEVNHVVISAFHDFIIEIELTETGPYELLRFVAWLIDFVEKGISYGAWIFLFDRSMEQTVIKFSVSLVGTFPDPIDISKEWTRYSSICLPLGRIECERTPRIWRGTHRMKPSAGKLVIISIYVRLSNRYDFSTPQTIRHSGWK
jgi:hypothetical protein